MKTIMIKYWLICLPIISASFGYALWVEFFEYPEWLNIPLKTIGVCCMVSALIQSMYFTIGLLGFLEDKITVKIKEREC